MFTPIVDDSFFLTYFTKEMRRQPCEIFNFFIFSLNTYLSSLRSPSNLILPQNLREIDE